MRCLVIEDHPVILFALNLIIKNNFPEFEVLTAAAYPQAIEYLCTKEKCPIDLVILGLTLSDENTLIFLKCLPAFSPLSSRVVLAFSHVVDQRTLNLCKTFDIQACIPKSTPISLIVHAIKVVISGGTYYDMGMQKAPDMMLTGIAKLTCRQKDVLNLVMAGYSNKKVASTLNLSYGTVKNYMFDLMRILRVRSRLELAVALRKSGYQPAPSEYDSTRSQCN